MHCIVALLVTVLHVSVVNGAVNYCGARMCGHSDAHTYCKYKPGPSPSCVGYVGAPLSAAERAAVLGRLQRRRQAAGGGQWPPAGDMMALRWVEELSREAQRWADQCRPPRTPEERDQCRDLYSISVGQCVASVVGEAPGLRPESMVDLWFMQGRLYTRNVTSYVPPRAKNYYGDFAQMMWSRTYLVGCGRSRFMTEWQGRLRSVERLVCNFAPRGPVPGRPLWTLAEPASVCPPRAHPDPSLPGLCTYQNDFKDSENDNESMSLQDKFLLETIFEIEKNESLDYLGSLDELYLTKIAIATIGTTMPVVPLYYPLQKRDVFGYSENDDELWNPGNKSEVTDNNISTDQAESTETTVHRTKPVTKTKVNTIGRPKPYDIDELNDEIWEKNLENPSGIQDLRKNKERDLYAEYGLDLTVEDDAVNYTTVADELTLPFRNDTATHTDTQTEKNGFTENNNATDGLIGSENSLTNATEDIINDLLMSNKSVDDYLSDPETVRALQDALEKMERTLASPGTSSTPGKVRRELRNLEADLQKVSLQVTTSPVHGTTVKDAESKDRGPMLSMVLKYMPYLKPYEDTIVGTSRSGSHVVFANCLLLGVLQVVALSQCCVV